MNGKPLSSVDQHTPEDSVALREALAQILRLTKKGVHREAGSQICFNLGNNATAIRFLTAFCAVQKGVDVVLDGNERMRQRPIGQLVDALREGGALIEGDVLPLHIVGQPLPPHRVIMPSPLSTQFVSALMLIGWTVTDYPESPYIQMTQKVLARFHQAGDMMGIERDWSSAAFWYEYVALHDEPLLLTDLHPSAMQGDNVVAELFAPLGVITKDSEEGICLYKAKDLVYPASYPVDFRRCPDLYPAIRMTCEQLGICLMASGISSLPYKESDRIRAMDERCTYNDHRIAMALLAADCPCDNTDCIRKSYPQFMEELCLLK